MNTNMKKKEVEPIRHDDDNANANDDESIGGEEIKSLSCLLSRKSKQGTLYPGEPSLPLPPQPPPLTSTTT